MAIRALTLSLPTTAFDELHAEADSKAKRPAKVDRESLRQLLLDHSRALALLDRMGVPFEEPEFEEPIKHNSKIRQAAEEIS